MNQLRKTGDNKDEAQRFNASQAPREVAELDPRSVLLVVKAHIDAGRIETAREIVSRWKAGTL